MRVSTNTWGISGPDFLLIYLALFLITWGAVLAVRERVRAAAGRASVSGQPALGLYEAAMLNGGGRLALAVAVCRLKEAGSVRLDPDRSEIVVSGPLPANADPVEEWAYRRVGSARDGGWGLLDDEVADPVLGPIRDRLQGLGLVPTAEQTALMRRQALWFAPLLALGAARVIAGTAHHRPVLYLVVLMLLALGVAINLCRLPRRQVSTGIIARLCRLPRTTRAGRSGAQKPACRAGGRLRHRRARLRHAGAHGRHERARRGRAGRCRIRLHARAQQRIWPVGERLVRLWR
jgi:uncharacterized protein (TIGR04222 family)